MKIITKKGSALEQTIKTMCEKTTDGFKVAQKIVEEFVGVKPIKIYHIFHWGTISKLVPEFVFNPDDLEKVNPHFLRKKGGCKNIYVPALRYKEGKDLDKEFRFYANKYEVTDKPLNRYGINMVDWVNGKSYYLQLAHDKEKDLYGLECSNGIPYAFNKKKLAKDQFEIEYF